MLIVHLFVSYVHVNLCHFFSSSWCQGLAATSACGSSWTFLFTLWHSPDGTHHNQIDYILVKKRFRSVKLTEPEHSQVQMLEATMTW